MPKLVQKQLKEINRGKISTIKMAQQSERKDNDPMCTKNELDMILQAMVKVYRAVYGERIIKIVLYGSYARGDYHNDSDIDIVAIVRGDRAVLQKGLKQVWDTSSDLELKYGTIVSPTVIPYEEFEKYKNDLPYYRNIQSEGVDIVA